MRGFDKKERRESERGSVKRGAHIFLCDKRKTKGEKTQNEESGTKQTKRKMTPPAAILFVSLYRSLEHV